MGVIRLFFESYEQDLFDVIGAESWVDVLECFLACFFIAVFAGMTLVMPMIFFISLWFSPFLF